MRIEMKALPTTWTSYPSLLNGILPNGGISTPLAHLKNGPRACASARGAIRFRQPTWL